MRRAIQTKKSFNLNFNLYNIIRQLKFIQFLFNYCFFMLLFKIINKKNNYNL